MNEPIIVDNFLHKIQTRQIEKLVHENHDLTWTYMRNYVTTSESMTRELMNNDKDILDLGFGAFIHMLYKGGKISSPYYDMFKNFVSLAESKFNIKVDKIFNMRINFSTPLGYETKKYTLPHFDTRFENTKALIYYINDSDGDTVIFNEYQHGQIIDVSKKTITHRITPAKGRAVLFDSNRYHAACLSSKNMRAVLNMNLILK